MYLTHNIQGRSYRGFGGFGRTPHGPEKVRKNRFFPFFFFERDRTGKRCRWEGRKDAANRKRVMQDEAWPGERSNGTSPNRRRRQRKPAFELRARRGVARCECQTPSYRSNPVYQRRASSSTDWYSGFHFFYAKLWTVAYEKPMVKKVWKKYEKSCDGQPSSPKSKRGGQAFGILAMSTTPTFWGRWGAFSRHVCPVTAGRNGNFAGQRPQITANSISCAVSLDRPPLSPRLSARWTQFDDHPLRDHVRERCGQGERRRLMHLTRSGLAPGWPPWWKWLRNVIFSFSDHFCLIFSRKRFRASYNTERQREIDGSDVTIVALKLAMNSHFHSVPKIRTIGDELTLSLAKNSHFSFLPSHFPSLPSRRGHHCGAEIRNDFTLSIAKNFFALFVPPLSNGTSRTTSDRKPKTNDQILPSPILFFPSKNWIKLIPKTIGNRKRDCAWGGSGW